MCYNGGNKILTKNYGGKNICLNFKLLHLQLSTTGGDPHLNHRNLEISVCPGSIPMCMEIMIEIRRSS